MFSKQHEFIKERVLAIYKSTGIKTFPININSILDFYGIKVYTYSSIDKELCSKYSEDSFSFGSKIFYDDTMYGKRIRFSLAHELGHIMLSHTRRSENSQREEREADIFAASLLVPLPAISKLKCKCSAEIAKHFNLSDYASIIAYKDYELYKRHDYVASYADIEMAKHLYSEDNKRSFSIYSMPREFLVAEDFWLYGNDL